MKIYQHQFSDAELDLTIGTLRTASSVATEKDEIQLFTTTIENLEETRSGEPIISFEETETETKTETPLVEYDMRKLSNAIARTHEIDESGDANFTKWLLEHDYMDNAWWERPFGALMTDFLVAANGPNWEEFLKTAKIGDVPPKTKEPK